MMPFFSSSLPPLPSLAEQLHLPAWERAGVELWVKRDDLLAPAPDDPFCGNKFRKLYFNLLDAHERGAQPLLSFGGAFSNHIAALASAGRHLGWPTVGIIRGEPVDNPTLQRARADGMHLHFVTRSAYRLKEQSQEVRRIIQQYANARVIPEGGSNALALQGCAVLGQEIAALHPQPTHVAVACGTGATLAGMLPTLPSACEAIGVSVLKGHFMAKNVQDFLSTNQRSTFAKWQVWEQYHHGGYARVSAALLDFIRQFSAVSGVPLEPIYTGKLFFALNQALLQGYFPSGSRVLAIHTGGLQG